MIDDALLGTLMTVEATSGDEERLVDLIVDFLSRQVPAAALHRVGNTLIAKLGHPRVAVFAHTDTVGFTLGYKGNLIPIGGPSVQDGVGVRCTWGDRVLRGCVRVDESEERDFSLIGEGPLGSRWVYDTTPSFGVGSLQGAYLDNRMGVYVGLHLLQALDDVVVAFTASEETSGRGAFDAARWLYENTTVRQCLIADITWATEHVQPGKGPAVSQRDAFVPRKAFFDRVRALAERSGVPHQIEIEASGSSDGGAIERSGLGMDWLFVGAAETGYHTASESLVRADAENMLRLYTALVLGLS